MRRSELIQVFVLEAISDDYEDLEKVTKEVADLGARCGLSVAREETLSALRHLIETGMASAYRLQPTPDVPKASQGVPPDDQMDNHYFWITEKGRERHLATGAEWPFREDGTL